MRRPGVLLVATAALVRWVGDAGQSNEPRGLSPRSARCRDKPGGSWAVISAMLVVVLAVSLGAGPPDGETAAEAPAGDDDSAEVFIDPLGPNAACYVCHQTFIFEEMATVHKAEKIGCIKCHGLSAAHANDENVGATPPDIKFARHQVDKSCVECHDSHDAPAREVLARFVDRELPQDKPAVCTDCHGEHRIVEAAEMLPVLGGVGN